MYRTTHSLTALIFEFHAVELFNVLVPTPQEVPTDSAFVAKKPLNCPGTADSGSLGALDEQRRLIVLLRSVAEIGNGTRQLFLPLMMWSLFRKSMRFHS